MHLHVEPLHFQYRWTVPADSVTPEAFESTYKDFSLTFDPDEEGLSRIAAGSTAA